MCPKPAPADPAPRGLGALAEAWRDPTAWDGTTEAGGVAFNRPTSRLPSVEGWHWEVTAESGIGNLPISNRGPNRFHWGESAPRVASAAS
jgi:hypothetical protein